MEQTRLFRLAPEAMTVAARFSPAAGWSVRVAVRRADETWPEVQEDLYECLTTSELYDVVCASLASKLGL